MIRRPSPNHGPRRGGACPDIVVLHHTVLPRDAALDRLCDPAAEVSAHWLVDCAGALYALVDEDPRAWHAGAGAWGAVTDVNSRSIGIELEGDGSDFPAPQMAGLRELLAAVLDRHAIHPARVIAHSDMAPGRKSDPGPRFDWKGLADSPPVGLAASPDRDAGRGRPGAPALRLSRRGDGRRTPRRFRLRFRPNAIGPADALDAGMAVDLAERFPVDRWDARA